MKKKTLALLITGVFSVSCLHAARSGDVPPPLDASAGGTVLSDTVTKEQPLPQDNAGIEPPLGDVQQGGGYATDQQVSLEGVSKLYPYDRTPGLKTKTPELMQDDFEMNIDKEVANRVLKQQRRYQRITSGIHDVAFLQKPIVKPFSAIDTIYVTTEYATTIVFPKGMSIQYAQSGTAFAINKFDQNVFIIQPNRDFQGTNIVVGLSDGKSNYVANIMVEKYLPGNIVKDNVEERYLSCGEYISTMITYINPPKIKPIEVLKRYFALFGETAIRNFKKNGSFDVITIGSMPFYIIRDERGGSIVYRDINFRISDRYEMFAEQTKGRR